MTHQQPRFSNTKKSPFEATLRKRVNEYFKSRNISKHGDYRVWIKTVFMFALWFVPYFLLISGEVTSGLGVWAAYAVMGVAMAGIGLTVMHDACHGSFSSNKTVNQIMGYSLNLLGGTAFNWIVQHNVLHHTYTNVSGVDEDISHGPVLRLAPDQEHRFMHRFQVYYAWFLYGLMTISWTTMKDFVRLERYKKMELIEPLGRTYKGVLTEVILSKIFYYSYVLVLPIIVIDQPWYLIVGSYLTLHFIAGLILGLIFQPAHVMESTDFPVPDENNTLDNQRAIHQITTTTNFATKSRFFSWYAGGLNFQIEHHLFPTISHIHYKKLSEIVKRTADEYGLPYYNQPTFAHAIFYHGRMLHKLGKPIKA